MNMENDTRLEGFEVIHAYTRAQAIEDGVLVDLSDLAREAGFRFPVAVTQGVWAVLNPTKELEGAGQDMAGRAWDMLTILRHAIRSASRTDEIRFSMVTDMVLAKTQLPVVVSGKTYYGCCAGCVGRLNADRKARVAADPVLRVSLNGTLCC